MAEFSKFVHVDLNAGVRNVPVEGGFFRRDALANRLGVIVSKDHEPVTLTGIIKGFVKYPPHDPPATGTDVTIYSFNGMIDPEDSSKAYIDLPAEAYYYNGTITVAIRNDVGDKKTVLATFTGYVSDSTDGTEGVPPHSLPDDIDQFISYLSQLETDIANVQTAAAQATRVNITQSKTDRVITVQTTGRTEAEDRTTTITEPTATISKEENGPYHLTVTDVNGTTQAEIPDPAAEVKKKVNRTSVTSIKTAYSDDGVVTVDDALDEPAKLTLSLEPKQNLHGYTHPWVGGAGKNLLPINTTSRTISGVDITVNKDSNGNNVSVTFNGTATGEVFFYITGVTSGIPDSMLGKRIILSGGKDGVIIRAWHYDGTNIATSADGNASFAFTCEQGVIDCRVPSGTTVNTTIYPMARLATETDLTYAPYSNICPITGFDTVNVTRTGKNLCPPLIARKSYNPSNGEEQVDNYAASTVLIPFRFRDNSFMISYDVSARMIVFAYDDNKEFIARTVAYAPGASVDAKATIDKNSFTSTVQDGKSIDDIAYIAIRIYWTTSGTETCNDPYLMAASHIQLELGSTATSYEPFGTVTSLPISASAGSTVYGGTVTLNEDGSGTLVVDRACVNASTLKWIKSALNNCFVASDGFPNELEVHASHHIFSGETSYGYTKLSYDGVYSSSTDRAISWRSPGSSASQKGVLIRDSNLSSIYADFNLTNFKTAVSDLEILIPITPTTHQLTATQLQTLIGTNHIWTDSGCEFTLDYHTDKYGKLDEVYSAFPEDSVGPDDVVTITDGADDIPIKSLEVSIEPKQDLHGYDHPWVGGAGKNKFDYAAFNATTDPTINLIDNGIRVTRSTAGTYIGVRYEIMDITQASTSYKLSCDIKCNIGQRVRVGIRSIPGNSFPNDGSQYLNCTPWFDMQAGETKHLEMTINYASGTSWYLSLCCTGATALAADTEFTNVQLESGSTATAYEPYSNICPISGWDAVEVTRTGKNLIPNNLTWTNGLRLEDGTITENMLSKYTCAIYGIKPNTRYVISGKFTDANIAARVYYLKANGSWISRSETFADSGAGFTYSFVTPAECGAIQVQCGRSYDLSNVQLELGSTPTSYEPYRSTTLPISLSRAGTVYGGTLDITTGKLTVDKEMYIQDGTGSISILSEFDSGNVFWDQTRYFPLDNYSTKYDTNLFATNTARNSNEAPYGSYVYSQTIRYKVPKNIAGTIAELKAYFAVHPLQILFPLATPITYQLSPHELTTLLGTNNVWSDAGQVTVEYRADPTTVINSLIKRIEVLEERT